MTASVHKSITVRASACRAFRIFTEGVDTWWPRTHQIGKSPMTKAVIEGRAGGRCYSEQLDGTECDWGRILVWEPPKRFVLAWQIDPAWQYEPEIAKSSEVEVQFTEAADGFIRVDLEHRYFERHGSGWEKMQSGVDSPGGWNELLRLFQLRAEESE